MKKQYDAIIIGAGPAGLSAALYLKRSNLDVLIVEKAVPGGMLNYLHTISNYPGLENVEGPTLAINMYKQVTDLGVMIEYGNVYDIIDGDVKVVKTKDQSYYTKAIIIATGRKASKLGLENEDQLLGHGLSYCAICDGPLYKNKIVAVIGSTDNAINEALYLSSLAGTVYLINPKSSFKASETNLNKLNQTAIKVLLDTNITQLNESNQKLISIDTTSGNLVIDGLFVYIGYGSSLDFTKNLPLDMDNGNIIVDQNNRTKVPFVYACGDVLKKDYYQIITAASEGAMAALSLKKDL